MHEASLAGSILQLLEDALHGQPEARVRAVRIEVGQLAGVEIAALRFALQALSPGTCLADARLQIDEPEGRAWCMDCGDTVPLARRGDPCPRCGGYRLAPTGGTALRVIEFWVEDP